MVRLKPSLKNFRGLYQRYIIFLITSYIILIYFAEQSEWITLIPFLFLTLLIIEIIPALYYSWSYYKVNKGQEFMLDSNSIEVRKKNNTDRYSADEIKQIEIFMSGNNPKFNVAFNSMEFFHYARIEMKNGEQIVITSLCAEQVDAVLEEYLPDVPIEYNWGFPNIGRLDSGKKEE